MSITLSATVSGSPVNITLQPDLDWPDRHNWSPVGQSAGRSIVGAMIIQARAMTAGRPITLQPSDDSSGWHMLSVVEQLRNLAAIPGLVMVLTINGETHNVLFRHQDGDAIQAEPVVQYREYLPTDFFQVTLKFMTV